MTTATKKRETADQARARIRAKFPDIDISDVVDPLERDPMRGFANHVEFFRGVLTHRPGQPPIAASGRLGKWARCCDSKTRKLFATAGSDEQSTFSDPSGGFLVPQAFAPVAPLAAAVNDPFTGRTTTIPMGTPSVSIPYHKDKDHTDSVTGGIVVCRAREEAAAFTPSRAELGRLTLYTYSLTALCYSTEELVSDSPQSIAGILESTFAREVGSRLVRERLNGSGTGEFRGVNASPALVSIAKETGQAADTIVPANVFKMAGRCWNYDGGAIWLATPEARSQIYDLNRTVPGTWTPPRSEGEAGLLLGRPLFFTEHCEVLGDAGDLVCVVPSEYVEGVYQALSTVESIHVRFIQHERAFKFWTRNAGAPWWDSVLTPANGGPTLSPFVRLGARA